METSKQAERISLARAATRLGLGYYAARDRVMRGELAGGQDERGRWWVSSQAVEQAMPGGRPTVYKSENAEIARQACGQGATNEP